MCEIDTDYELLQISSASRARAARAPEPINNDRSVLHHYHPHVQSRRAQPLDLGGTTFESPPATRSLATRLTPTDQLGITDRRQAASACAPCTPDESPEYLRRSDTTRAIKTNPSRRQIVATATPGGAS